VEKKEILETEEGGFLLESLGKISAVDVSAEEEKKRSNPRTKEKKSLFFGKDNIIGIDPNRELRELRERQQKLERRIFTLTMTFLVTLAVFIVGTQTSLGGRAVRLVASSLGGGESVNCQIASNYNLPECIDKRNNANADWKAIERGKNTQFTLHGK
jgi:hypothetical protein